jgi:hypothetical protein
MIREDLSEAMQQFIEEFCTRTPFPYNSQEDMLLWYKLRNEVPLEARDATETQEKQPTPFVGFSA